MSEGAYAEPAGSEVEATDGWSGSEASHERAVNETKSGLRQKRRNEAVRSLADAAGRGLTWKELADFRGWHHGQASGVLSVLHKEGRIVCLTLKRNRCHIYMLPEYAEGRETREAGRTAANRASLAVDAIDMQDRLTAAAGDGYDRGYAEGHDKGWNTGTDAGWQTGYDAAMDRVGDVDTQVEAAYFKGEHEGIRVEAQRIHRLTIEMRRTIDGHRRANGMSTMHRPYKDCWIEHPACALLVIEKALANSLPLAPRKEAS